MFLVIILICYVVAMSGCAWSLYCNNKTHSQLNDLIDRIGAVADPVTYDRLYRLLDVRYYYERHHRRLMTFRDPWAIYPAELANLMRVTA